MTALIDGFGTGLLLGLLMGTPIFVSARIAIGLFGSTAAGVLPFVITNGVEAFGKALEALVKAIGADPKLAVGLAIGIAIAGILSVVFRKFTSWR
jgi:hypothetical protein